MGLRNTSKSILIVAVFLAAIILMPAVQSQNLDSYRGEGRTSNLITSVPRTMSYQGILKDSGGDPVTDSIYSVIFRIFNVESGGSSLWDQTLPCTTSAGYFDAVFSNVNLPFDEDYWLELEIDSEILDPRQKMNMVGYSAVSDTADYAFATSAGGDGWVDDGTVVRLETVSDSVGIGTTSPSGKLHVATDGTYSGYFTSDHLSGSTHIVHAEYTGTTGSAGPKAVYGKAVPEDGDGWGGYFEGGYRGVQGIVMPTGSEEHYTGVFGYVDGGNGNNFGVHGSATNGNSNRGVTGEAGGPGVQNIGVYGTAQGATENWAGYFYGDVKITSDLDVGGDIRATGKATIGPGHTNSGTNAFVVGRDNTASNDEAFVAGQNNVASGFRSTISGGDNHVASGMRATISGGMNNEANGHFSSVGGGDSDTANGTWSTIGGGYGNRADDSSSTVSGGRLNTADGIYSTVGGGLSNTASDTAAVVGGGKNNSAAAIFSTASGGKDNSSSGEYSTIAGGRNNTASNDGSAIGGGNTCIASGQYSVVAGGNTNTASGGFSVVAGGVINEASGLYSCVPGGQGNTASGTVSFAAGRQARAVHNGTFVWADQTTTHFTSTNEDQFLIRASGGVGVGTTNPQGALDVSSTTGAFIVPRMTTAQRDALTGVNGMIIYNTTTNQFNFYENGFWVTK